MKKILQLLVASVAILSIGFTPVLVHAQGVETVDEPDTTTLPSTGGTEAAAPDTGIAPSNHVAQNTAVFVGGSILGAGIGLGLVALRKKKFNQ